APDRLRQRAHVRPRRRHAARRRQGLPAHAAQRRGLGRGTGPDARARRLLQPGLGEQPPTAKGGAMGGLANVTLLADAISSAQSFVWAFTVVYTLVIFA